ncbi:MAG TPA: hypothetical protein VG755_32875 [Nannocystaceae bacterium]|nr:hypothetical protein [Nannocystaceae bacterium]
MRVPCSLVAIALASACGDPAASDDDDGSTGASAASTASSATSTSTSAGTSGGLESSSTLDATTSVDASTSGESTGDPDTVDDTGVPATDGWIEIPATHLADVCPPSTDAYDFSYACQAVLTAWNGAIADTTRDRLIVWGGGHGDYFGNEVYALDLDAQTLVRLNDPSPIDNVGDCPFSYVDGTPSSRHTYDGLAYLEHADAMFLFGGSRASCGFLADDTWTLDLATLSWTDMQPAGEHPGGNPGVVADYDADSGAVYLHDTAAFWRYELEGNAYTKLSDSYIDYHMTGRIDPVRQEFVIVGCSGCGDGGGAKRISIAAGSDYALEELALDGCDDLLAPVAPGLAWDPVREQLVGWPGGTDVFALDLAALACTRFESEGGPGDAQGNGTYGRWRYFPDEGVFAVVNDWQSNAYAFRLTR